MPRLIEHSVIEGAALAFPTTHQASFLGQITQLTDAVRGHYGEPIAYQYPSGDKGHRHVSAGILSAEGMILGINVQNGVYSTYDRDQQRIDELLSSSRISLHLGSLFGLKINEPESPDVGFMVGPEAVEDLFTQLPKDQAKFLSTALDRVYSL